MTEEQYKRAVEISERLGELDEVRRQISDARSHHLSYAWKGEGEWCLHPNWVMSQIGEILDRHDVMIRQEIEDEIKKLKEEIKTL